MGATLFFHVFLLAAQDPAAMVNGRPVRAADVQGPAKELAAHIKSLLVLQYARDHRLGPTVEELIALSRRMERDLTDTDRRRLAQERLQRFESTDPPAPLNRIEDLFSVGLIVNWKVGKALFERHGGRVHLSAFGMHSPVDAMEKFLLEEERAGRLVIPDPEKRTALWAVWSNNSGSGRTVQGAAAREVYKKPIWE